MDDSVVAHRFGDVNFRNPNSPPRSTESVICAACCLALRDHTTTMRRECRADLANLTS